MPFLYPNTTPQPVLANPVQYTYTGQAIAQSDKDCIEAARTVFNNILTEDLAPANYNGNPAYTGVDIDVSVNNTLAGTSTIAQAAPSQLRPGTPRQALAGWVEINPDFLPSGAGPFASCDLLTASCVHEIFHILSFNPVFFVPSFAASGNCGPDGQSETADDSANGKYTGAIALAEYRTAIGNPVAPHVPMTCQSAHWLENNRFGDTGLTDELMTPYADTPSPLSRVTIATLEDLQYPGVSYAEAEIWP